MNVDSVPRPHILIADADPNFARSLQESLTDQATAVARSASEAAAIVKQNLDLYLAFLDFEIPPTGAVSLMRQLRWLNPSLSMIVMSGVGTPDGAVDAMRFGADDYLVKPFNQELIVKRASRLLQLIRLSQKARQQEAGKRTSGDSHDTFRGLHLMQEILDKARRAAEKATPILLVGECGVGKDKLARAIHASGPRANGPFFLIDCRSFGHELPGRDRFVPDIAPSSVPQANLQRMLDATAGGTLFLNEVGELPPEVQPKLIEAMEALTHQCKADIAPVKHLPHILSSTSRSLPELRRKCLHERLYSRLGKVLLRIPPLRERPDDVIQLAGHFLARLSQRYNRQFTLTWAGLDFLMRYPFPGNVRELESILERATAFSFQTPHEISDADLQLFCSEQALGSNITETTQEPMDLRCIEQLTIERALRNSRGNQTRAAALLGISRAGLYLKLRRLRNEPKRVSTLPTSPI